MKIVHVTSEVAPFAHTGGLGDVLGALPRAQQRAGGRDIDVVTMMPFYRAIRERAASLGVNLDRIARSVAIEVGGRHFAADFIVLRRSASPVVCAIDVPELFDRPGFYGDQVGHDYADNATRFAAFGRAALVAAEHFFGQPADIVHAHDWQSGLAPVYARVFGLVPERTAIVQSIHNLAYQGVFHKESLPQLGLPWSTFKPELLEYHDQISFLKGGIAWADAVATVSPTYAEEILTERFGAGLDGFLRSRASRGGASGVRGILNGIDVDGFNPATDPDIAAAYDREDLDGRAICRAALGAEFGYEPRPDELVIGVVTRLVEQKGIDMLAGLVPKLAGLGARLVLLGKGEPRYEAELSVLDAEPGSGLDLRLAFDGAVARRIYAGADAILVPSRFEPCGLTQLYAMRYGAVPIVHAVGGLRDTVEDPGDLALAAGDGCGFRFDGDTVAATAGAVERAANLFRDRPDAWRRIALNGMRRDFSWNRSARSYLELYRGVLALRARMSGGIIEHA